MGEGNTSLITAQRLQELGVRTVPEEQRQSPGSFRIGMSLSYQALELGAPAVALDRRRAGPLFNTAVPRCRVRSYTGVGTQARGSDCDA